jgi:hypothetical protein
VYVSTPLHALDFDAVRANIPEAEDPKMIKFFDSANRILNLIVLARVLVMPLYAVLR